MDTEELNIGAIVNEFSEVLKVNVLPFWRTKMIDHERGGFIGQIDGNNIRYPEADKSVILNARILWTFSAVHQQLPDKEYREIAERAYRYLLSKFLDKEDGGVYWTLDAEGNPKDGKKQIYAQAFMIYALAEYYKISKDEEALQQAVSLFELVEKYSWDTQYEGYLEAFDSKWNLLEDLRLSDKDANEKKTMNTHLHVLEAYTNLYRIWSDEKLAQALKTLIELFLEKFIDDKGHFRLFFDEQWISKSSKISFGHDIEGSWLLYETAEVLGDESILQKTKMVSLLMVDQFVEEGIATNYGVYNEAEDGHYDEEFHWWPQAEALVGLANAWQLTGNKRYLVIMERIWLFIKDHIIDHKNGEWHWGVDAKGNILKNEDKAGPWKCPYHNSRALLEGMRRLRQTPI